MISPASRLDELAQALEGALPELDGDGVRLAFALYRQLAKGRPVGNATLVADTQISAKRVQEILASWPGVFTDDNGNIVGFWGLTVLDMPPHRYRLGDKQLSTWCALDALFITKILDATASVESVDALSGEAIRLSVTPHGVEEPSPSGLVVSFLQPDGKFDADVIVNFCHFVHFFVTRQNGERWAAQHEGICLLDVDDAFRLGERFVQSIVNRGQHQ